MRWGLLGSAAIGVVLLGDCGINTGFVRDAASISQREYRMDVSQERFVRTVSGSASTGSLLCLFPISSELYKRAMQELYTSARLEPNQTVLNLREDHQTVTYLLFYCAENLTISGDLVEMTPVSPTPSTPPPAKPAP